MSEGKSDGNESDKRRRGKVRERFVKGGEGTEVVKNATSNAAE